MDWIVDRIEGDTAVILAAGMSFDLPCAALPAGTREGARLRLELTPATDPQEAAARMARLAAQSAVPDSVDL